MSRASLPTPPAALRSVPGDALGETLPGVRDVLPEWEVRVSPMPLPAPLGVVEFAILGSAACPKVELVPSGDDILGCSDSASGCAGIRCAEDRADAIESFDFNG